MIATIIRSMAIAPWETITCIIHTITTTRVPKLLITIIGIVSMMLLA